MFLCLEVIKNWFVRIFEEISKNINVTTLIIFLTGILIGLVIAGCFYTILLLKSLKKVKKIKKITVDNEEIEDIVKNIKIDLQKDCKGKSLGTKFNYLGDAIKQLVTKIAKSYYPKSKHPLMELSIEEVLITINYISERINKMFDKPVLRLIMKVTIKQLFTIYDFKKRLDHRMIKNTSNVIKRGFMVKNILNPYYWTNKILVGQAIYFTSNKLFAIVIDIVAEETTKVYSKKLFNTDQKMLNLEMEKSLQDLEKYIEEENYE